MESAERYTEESEADNKSILLNRNFRSSPQVIDFVNFMFGMLMTRNCGEVDYTEDEKLYFGAVQYKNDSGENRLTGINFINTDSEAVEDIDEDESFEAEITADKIAEMLQMAQR